MLITLVMCNIFMYYTPPKLYPVIFLSLALLDMTARTYPARVFEGVFWAYKCIGLDKQNFSA